MPSPTSPASGEEPEAELKPQIGWGERDWAETEGNPEYDDPEYADLERLRADRPPHHEERER